MSYTGEEWIAGIAAAVFVIGFLWYLIPDPHAGWIMKAIVAGIWAVLLYVILYIGLKIYQSVFSRPAKT